MINIFFISVFICGTVNFSRGNFLIGENATKKTFIYNTYNYDTIINVVVNGTTEQILDFVEDCGQWCRHPTRVHVSSDSALEENPLFITARQQKSVSSWELPLVVQGRSAVTFTDMARTLCPHDAGPNITSINPPTIQLATSNPSNVSVNIKLRRVHNFYVEVNKEVQLNVTPSSPKYYYFSFDSDPWNVTEDNKLRGLLPRFKYTIPKSVILIIESDDDLCAVVSIQNNSCPVFDNENDVQYQGYHLTMMKKGGITLTQSMFPLGFYIVFIVKQTSEECTGVKDIDTDGHWGVSDDRRVKNFRFRVVATISYKEYVVAALVVVAVALTLYVLVVLLTYIQCRWTEEVLIIEEEPGPSTSRVEDIADDARDRRKIVISDSFSDSESELLSTMPQTLTVAGLSRARPNAQTRRSGRYFWSALTVAVVYALPVVQLLVTYQYMVLQTGDQDLCYYNFLCAHPLGVLSDFNHVYSNAAYVMLGLAFMLQTSRRQAKNVQMEVGIPHHPGLFYSMGLALAMEGVLSACYHLCPNKMNFQFDSSFMYVIAVLCMVKLYQNRHPDVNASAHSTFMLLAVIMAIGLFGIMYPSVYFWTLFTILHLATCLVLTLKIYYVGKFRIEWSVLTRASAVLRERGRHALRPRYTARAVLLAIANLANWALAAYGLYEHNKDFARHLLAILMGNAILYTLFYVVMKLVHRERILLHTWLYFIFAHVAWFTALRLFLDSKTKWSQTPAQSRERNAVCSALQFYDSHDLWHVASAAAMFLSFNVLLTVDDALADAPRDRIPVF